MEIKVSERKKLSEKIKEKENQLRKQEELKKKELEEDVSYLNLHLLSFHYGRYSIVLFTICSS